MAKHAKLRDKILAGSSDTNIQFFALCQLLKQLGFDQHVRGSHHIFAKEAVAEIINRQPKAGKAKPYQVKQVRSILLKYRLGDPDVDKI